MSSKDWCPAISPPLARRPSLQLITSTKTMIWVSWLEIKNSNVYTANVTMTIKFHTGDIYTRWQTQPKYTAFTSKGAGLSCHFKILDSISSKLKPFVSGTEKIMNKSDRIAIAPKRRKRFSAPRNSCSRSQHSLLTPRAVRQFKMTKFILNKK